MIDTKDAKYINTNKPRESIVINDTDGDGVVKMPTTTRPEYIKVWLQKQRHANITVKFLLANPNRLGGYFIPKITEINPSMENPHVREQRAPGGALTKDVFDSLSIENQDKIYKSLANFVYDMNHCRPILTMQQQLAQINEDGLTFDDVVNHISGYLDKNEIAQINNAYKFFQSHPEMTSSFVFFHGDMNENNMFYDAATGTVSFLDFAEANYKSIEYIFNHDLIKLPWLDTNKLLKYYKTLLKQNDVRTESNPAMITLFNALRDVRRTGESMIAYPNKSNAFVNILHQNIKQITNAYGAVIANTHQNSHTL